MINDERRDAIFAQMNEYIIALDTTATGPRYFIDKIAQCRNFLNQVSLVLSELQKDKLITTSELSKLQAIVELESANLLANDDQVRRLANIKDREAMIMYILRDRFARINFLKDQLHSIDGVMKHTSLRARELHATMDAIKNQRRFMHIEVSTGAFYGDERIGSHELNVGMGLNGEGDLRQLIEASQNNDAVSEMNAALDAAAQAAGFDAPTPLALPPAPPVAPAHVVTTEVVAVVVVAPVVEAEPLESDEAALHDFLGDVASEPTKKEPVVAFTDEPSKSAAQVEIEDIASLLDDV